MLTTWFYLRQDTFIQKKELLFFVVGNLFIIFFDQCYTSLRNVSGSLLSLFSFQRRGYYFSQNTEEIPRILKYVKVLLDIKFSIFFYQCDLYPRKYAWSYSLYILHCLFAYKQNVSSSSDSYHKCPRNCLSPLLCTMKTYGALNDVPLLGTPSRNTIAATSGNRPNVNDVQLFFNG